MRALYSLVAPLRSPFADIPPLGGVERSVPSASGGASSSQPDQAPLPSPGSTRERLMLRRKISSTKYAAGLRTLLCFCELFLPARMPVVEGCLLVHSFRSGKLLSVHIDLRVGSWSWLGPWHVILAFPTGVEGFLVLNIVVVCARQADSVDRPAGAAAGRHHAGARGRRVRALMQNCFGCSARPVPSCFIQFWLGECQQRLAIWVCQASWC